MVDVQQDVLRALALSVARPGCLLLEVGSWCGDSAIVLGQVAKENGGHLFCVDWWKGSPETYLTAIAKDHDVHFSFWKRMCEAGLSDVVVPIRGDANVVAGLLRPGVLDMVFIDGDHRYEQVVRDIENYGPMVRPGGVFAGHDCEGRVDDFDRETLIAGKDTDCHNNLHCGVILAVDGHFPIYSINCAIWSVLAGLKGQWRPTNLNFPKLPYDGDIPARFMEARKRCNLIRFGGEIHVISQDAGEIDLTRSTKRTLDELRENRHLVTARSLAQARKWVDEHSQEQFARASRRDRS